MGVLWTNVLDTDYSNEVYSDDDNDNNIKETEVTEIKFTSDQDMTLQLSHIEHENYKGFSVLARMYRNSIKMMEHALNDTYYDLRTDPLKGKVKTLIRCQKCIKLLTEAIEAGITITITSITITCITIITTSINLNISIIL
jgi:predicted membrane GTPase involved in stress response